MNIRINRFLSQAGFGSRRHCEELVREGRVSLNGQIICDLSTRVEGESDEVKVDGHLAEASESNRLLIHHKKRGVVCSFKRQGRAPCLLDVLPDELRQGRLFHVGRLDADSSGLLLLSDDGELGNRLLHPSHPVWKRYEMTINRPLHARAIERILEGDIVLDGSPCLPAKLEHPDAEDRRQLVIEIREGRNRQLRRMMKAVGREVLRLHRVAIGPLELGDLAEGGLRDAVASELEAVALISRSARGVDEGPART